MWFSILGGNKTTTGSKSGPTGATVTKQKNSKHPNINIKRLKNVLSKQKTALAAPTINKPAGTSKKNQPKKSIAEDAREKLQSGQFRSV